MICPNCGNTIKDTAVFCRYCGIPLELFDENSVEQDDLSIEETFIPEPEFIQDLKTEADRQTERRQADVKGRKTEAPVNKNSAPDSTPSTSNAPIQKRQNTIKEELPKKVQKERVEKNTKSSSRKSGKKRYDAKHLIAYLLLILVGILTFELLYSSGFASGLTSGKISDAVHRVIVNTKNRTAEKNGYSVIYCGTISFPQTMDYGENVSIEAGISCDPGILTDIQVVVYNISGTEVRNVIDYSGNVHYLLSQTDMASRLNLSRLSSGEYFISLIANAENEGKITQNQLYYGNLTVNPTNKYTTQESSSQETTAEEQAQESKIREESNKTAEETPPVLSIAEVGIPTHLVEGEGCSIFGKISTNKGNLTLVTVTVYDKSGNAVLGRSAVPNKPDYSLWNSQIDKNLAFGTLNAGTYTMEISAAAEYKTLKTEEILFTGNFGVAKNEKTPTIKISGVSVPTTLTQGKGFSLQGKISTDCGKLTSVLVSIYDSNKTLVQQQSAKPDAATYQILNSSIDNNLKFGNLAVGTYTIKISAAAINNGKETNTTLVEQTFTIKKAETKTSAGTETSKEQTTYQINQTLLLQSMSPGDVSGEFVNPEDVFGHFSQGGYRASFYDGEFTIDLGVHTLTGSYTINNNDYSNLKLSQYGYNETYCLNEYPILAGKTGTTSEGGTYITIWLRDPYNGGEAYHLNFS